jgi:hypothetical protein
MLVITSCSSHIGAPSQCHKTRKRNEESRMRRTDEAIILDRLYNHPYQKPNRINNILEKMRELDKVVRDQKKNKLEMNSIPPYEQQSTKK